LHLNPYQPLHTPHAFHDPLIGKMYLVDAGYACRNGFLPPYRGLGTICLSTAAPTGQPMQDNCLTWDTPHLGSQLRGLLGLWRIGFVF
jgi:hypothetical protein